MAFGLLFVFHSWRPFDHLEWHIKNDQQHVIFDILTMFTHGWRMHLIFLVSGAGTWFALRARKGKFISDRLKRLITPFILGILIIVPPQRYFEWKMFRGFNEGFIDFLMVYPIEQLDANMGSSVLLWFGHLGTHLWYLPFLFVMTIACIPLFKSIKNGKIGFNWLKNIISTRFGIFVLVIPMLICRLLFKPVYPQYTDWGDFFIYLWPFVYGFIFMADKELITIVKNKRKLLLITGILSSTIFMYMGVTSEQMIEGYINPEFNSIHLINSFISMIIALSWTLYFLGLFAKRMDFKHQLLIPANISILPIYVLHQTLIIVFGYYIIHLDINVFIKFVIITVTAIPTSILLYQLIRKNNLSRFLFGMKPIAKLPEQKISLVNKIKTS